MITYSPHQLMAPNRRAEIPQDLALEVQEPKGYHGLCTGRNTELNAVATYFPQQYEAEAADALEDDDCIACILMNAPGAGKTTLREKFAKDQEEAGVTVIELSTGALMHPDAFVEALLEHSTPSATVETNPDDPMVKLHNGLWALWGARHTYGPAIAGGLIAMAGVPELSVPVATGTATLMSVQEQLARNYHKELVARGTLTPRRALRLLSDTYQGKYLITVDEGQTTAQPELNRDGLHEVLSVICSPSVRKRAGIRGGGLLISGLGNVKDHLDGLGLSRAKTIWLGSLNETQAAEIIAHEITRKDTDAIAAERLQRVLADWPTALAGTFHPWPQHAAIVGRVAQRLLTQRPNSTKEEEARELEWVKTQAAKQIVDLYARRLGMALEDADPMAPIIIAAMRHRTDQMLSKEAVYLAVEDCKRQRGLDLSPAEVKATLSQLKRCGIIRDAETMDPRVGTIEGYRPGIPSIADHTATVTRTKTPERWQRATKLAEMYLTAASTGNTEPILAKSAEMNMDHGRQP